MKWQKFTYPSDITEELIAVVLYPHKARDDDELTLAVKDVVTVTDKDEKTGWWKGKLKDREGIFPSTCVHLLQLEKASSQKSLVIEPRP